ncbi:MAG: DUF4347 domain-containing protein, partial [Planctomycetales bacterium]|nr:DUF4347 domain-containing protein [Planctomycetales bacterium]
MWSAGSLERRVMLAGDVSAATTVAASAEVSVSTPECSAQHVAVAQQSLVVVDTSVPDFEMLIADVDDQAEVVLLDADADGVRQLTAILAHRSQIRSLHVVTHGRPGEIQLGNRVLSATNIPEAAPQLQQ